MADWAWHSSDLASGLELGPLPVAAWSHEDRLDSAGQFSAQLAPRGAQLNRMAIDSTLAGRSLVVPVRNRLPLGYAGVVWAPDPPRIAGASLLSYFDAQTYDTTRVFASTDQHAMMVALVDWVQANGGNVRVDTSQVGPSGVLRDQTWNVWEQKNVGEALRQKADNIGGYDFDFRVELAESGEPIRRMRMWTPRRGRAYVDQECPVFTVGGNVHLVPSAPANGASRITHGIALGEEVDSVTHERLVARSIRQDLLDAGYPRLVGQPLNRPDIKDLTTLQQAADGAAYYYGASPIDEIVLQVDPDDRTWPWGSWDLGDDCLVRIPLDIDPWWPTGLEQVRRIVAHRWNVSTSGEVLQVVTGPALD